MVDANPFRGLRYAAPLDARVYAPPYDIIDAEQRGQLLARSAHNIAHLDVGPTPPDPAWYAQAAGTLCDWLAQGVLRRDLKPAFYGYRQAFTWTGCRYIRTGFFARVRLAPWGKDIHRHELTRNQPKADRLQLMRALDMQTSPVFGLLDSDGVHAAPLLERSLSASTALVQFADDDGVEHHLWAISDPNEIAELRRAVASSNVVIADGHHRYETSLALSIERRAAHGPSPADDVLMCLVPRDDPGLLILPTHRVLHTDAMPHEALLAALHRRFIVAETDLPLERAIAGCPQTLGLRLRGASYILRALPGSEGAELLDVALLQRCLLEPILGITPAQVAAGDLISYTVDAQRACAEVDGGKAALAVILNPTPLDVVWQTALKGEVMPQKSTFFHPKLLTGLVMNPLCD